MEGLLIFIALLALIFVPAMYSAREYRLYQERLNRLRPRNTIFSDQAAVRVSHPSQPVQRWEKALLFVTDKHIVAYAKKGDDVPLFTCLAHEIEGFWRPYKYQNGTNGIEIHANAAGRWTILKARLTKSRMMALVRVLKQLVDEEIVRAYRQRRPYIYRPPAAAHLAAQDLHGMWHHETPFKLYLTPATLVFLSAEGDDRVERVIKLREVQNIRVLPRLDGDAEGGLLAFNLSTTLENTAVALEDHDTWAQSIATAARRTLEEPVTRKRKGKADDDLQDDEDWDNGDFDATLWASQEYVLGEDGELEPQHYEAGA